jgi:hypothetical protein
MFENPEKMTEAEQIKFLVHKLGSNFIAAMFKKGFTHFAIAAVLARASGECCPSKEHLEELHNVINTGFEMMENHLVNNLTKEELR